MKEFTYTCTSTKCTRTDSVVVECESHFERLLAHWNLLGKVGGYVYSKGTKSSENVSTANYNSMKSFSSTLGFIYAQKCL